MNYEIGQIYAREVPFTEEERIDRELKNLPVPEEPQMRAVEILDVEGDRVSFKMSGPPNRGLATIRGSRHKDTLTMILREGGYEQVVS